LTTPELLFIRRAGSAPSPGSSGSHARWSSHIAFPGGRHEPSDESALYTAFRETWEEIGVDLAEREFVQVGRLDEREITTSLGKRLLMILSPFGGSRWILLATDREPRIVLILISLPPNNAVQPNARVASRE
jgi:8-oxo-dGTP pyrophosphatase MutT (NUDIX family)